MKMNDTKKSFLCFWILLAVSTGIALFRLGASEIPHTSWNSNQKGTEIVLDFKENLEISGIAYYLGNYENRVFSIETASDENQNWEAAGMIEMPLVYQWGVKPLNIDGRYIRLKTEKVYTQLNELLFIDRAGQIVRPVNSYKYPELFDEEALYTGGPSYQTGTVFDEPVFARTAYEYLHGLRSFEDTHPPMGKILISIGVAFFGMNPFGWRIMGVFARSVILILIWLFGKKLFRNPWIAVWTAAIFAFDFLPFTHSRLAQVDTFLVAFMLSMYYFMYSYGECLLSGQTDHRSIKWKQPFKNLLFSGISMGFAVSCKWSGCYGAAGLALVWLFYTIYAYRIKKINRKELGKLIVWCIVSFLFIPGVIYYLSYIPYISIDPSRSYFEEFVLNQINMFRYHSRLTAVHSQSSQWYQWPLIAKCITYISTYTQSGEEHVFLLGNPFFWFPGLLAVFYTIYEILEQKDRKGLVLLIIYLSPLLPWMFISRTSFLYHYFPSLPAMVLMIGYWSEKSGKRSTYVLAGIAASSMLAFLIFYPILSGMEISVEYLQKLQWLPWWDFMSM